MAKSQYRQCLGLNKSGDGDDDCDDNYNYDGERSVSSRGKKSTTKWRKRKRF